MTYRQHLSEAAERAFVQWQASGYRDTAAHDEAIRLFALLMWATYEGVKLDGRAQRCS
jgi:hypothetical protein